VWNEKNVYTFLLFEKVNWGRNLHDVVVSVHFTNGGVGSVRVLLGFNKVSLG
jgi:hypothetical protein